MTPNERRACDGLLPDDAPIGDSMEWLRQHCERLAWELEATGSALTEASEMLRKRERQAE